MNVFQGVRFTVSYRTENMFYAQHVSLRGIICCNCTCGSQHPLFPSGCHLSITCLAVASRMKNGGWLACASYNQTSDQL